MKIFTEKEIEIMAHERYPSTVPWVEEQMYEAREKFIKGFTLCQNSMREEIEKDRQHAKINLLKWFKASIKDLNTGEGINYNLGRLRRTIDHNIEITEKVIQASKQQ